MRKIEEQSHGYTNVHNYILIVDEPVHEPLNFRVVVAALTQDQVIHHWYYEYGTLEIPTLENAMQMGRERIALYTKDDVQTVRTWAPARFG